MRKRDVLIIFSAVAAALVLVMGQFFWRSVETGAWGLSFQDPGQSPQGPLSSAELKKYDAAYMGAPEKKVLYLTFDAGYENGNVKKTVDILKENGVTGAFFVLKHFIEENPDLCREIKDNGNLLCNHTSSHPAITSVSKERLENEIRGLEECCREKTGLELDRFFRPPEGTWSEEALKTVEDMGYKTVFWSLAWADWDNSNQKSAEYALNKLLPRIHDGAVILLHPTSQTNTEILGEIITRMKAEGYRFASLEELWESAES